MRGPQHWKFRMLVLILAPAIFAAPGVAQVSVPTVHFASAGSSGGKVIIIGFVGGFVSQDDAKHPEVQFATYLRDRYPLIEAVVLGTTMEGRLFMRWSGCSTLTVMEFSRPTKRGNRQSLSTGIAGVLRRPSLSPTHSGKWGFPWHSQSK